MAAYYVIGSVFVVWALVLTAMGIMRRDFPPTREAGRRLIALSAMLFIATIAVLLLVTEREHPREEAKAKASEEAAAREEPAPGAPEGGKAAAGKIAVVESEYSIKLPKAGALEAGPYGFDVANEGKIPHDLAVEGPGFEKKTPLIQPGDEAKLDAELRPGTFRLICTVPGHEQLGMRTTVTVR